MNETRNARGNISRRVRRFGVTALMVAGSAGAAAAIGGQAHALLVVGGGAAPACLNPTATDQALNTRFHKASGVNLLACNGHIVGSVNPSTLTGQAPVTIPSIPVNVTFPEPPIPSSAF